MHDASPPPDPYCAFKDDRLRRLALEDRNRRDVRIAWVRFWQAAMALGGLLIASSLVPSMLPWLMRALGRLL